MTQPLVTVHSHRKSYWDRQVLYGVSLHLDTGEVLGMIGLG